MLLHQALFVILCLIAIHHVVSEGANLRQKEIKKENKQGKVGSLTLCFWPFYIGCYDPTPGCDPTPAPTTQPTLSPTAKPTANPTVKPTAGPTANPTTSPSAVPTAKPSGRPTANPTDCPVESPTVKPTSKPTTNPTVTPTAGPTGSPTTNPTPYPTTTPTTSPTVNPTANPTTMPTTSPTTDPTVNPSNYPTIQPSGSPVANPTVQPTPAPSTVQSNTPSALPSKIPSSIPTLSPSAKVTNAPSYMDGCDGSPTASPTYKPCPVSNNTINFHITLSLSNYSGSCFSQEEILAVLLDLSFASKLHPCFFSYYNTPSNSLPATVLSYHSLRGSASLNNRKAQYSLTFAVSIPLVEEYAAYESNPTALFNNITAVLSESQSNKHLTQWLRVPENTVQKGAGDLQFTEIVSISFSGSSTTVQSQGAPSSSNKSIWSLYFNYFLVAIIICGLLLIAFLAAFLYSRYRTHHRSQKFPELQKLHAVEEKLPPSSAPLQSCSRNSLNSLRSAEVKYPSVYSQGDESMPSYDLENDFIAVTLLYENEEKTGTENILISYI